MEETAEVFMARSDFKHPFERLSKCLSRTFSLPADNKNRIKIDLISISPQLCKNYEKLVLDHENLVIS